MPKSPQLLSGRVEVTPYGNLSPDRYQFLGLSQAEPSLGSGTANSVLSLGAANSRVWTDSLDISSLSVTGNITGGNIFTGGNISAAGNITAANFSSGGNVNLGNLTVSNTTISTTWANGNIIIQPTGTGLLEIDTTTGMILPVGNTSQRPSSAETGTVRFNTDSARLELYDGTSWEDVVANVTNQTFSGDGSTLAFSLDRATTTAAALVAINGVVQLPATAYTVTGNTITFAQPPTITDTIDIRFL